MADKTGSISTSRNKKIVTDHCNNIQNDRKRKNTTTELERLTKRKKSISKASKSENVDSDGSGMEKENEKSTNAISIRVKKVKQNDEKLELQKHQEISSLNKFVHVSMKYSAFLESKISTSTPSSSSRKDDTLLSGERSIRPDIMERLKYFEGILRPYQEEGVTWLTVLFENSVNGILGDEMGLGKTVQIIALLCHLYERKVPGPFLIIAPLSTLPNWNSEFQRFAPEIPALCLHGNAEERRDLIKLVNKKYDLRGTRVGPVVITSYQIPLFESNFFASIPWQYVIVDEGHRIKNPTSKLSQELRKMKSTNRLLLTGTPLQNNIQELWALLHFLMPQLFKDPNWLSTLLELDEITDKKKLLQNEANSHLISKIQKTLSPFLLRREKKYVLNDITPKREVEIFCGLTEMQRYLYRATLQQDVAKLTMQKLDEDLGGKRRLRSRAKYFGEDFTEEEIMNTASSKFCRDIKNVPIKIPDTAYRCSITLQNVMMMLREIVNHPYLVWCPLKPNSGGREMYISEDIIHHSGKLQILDAMLPILKARKHKILIFSTFVMFMDIIEEMLIMRNHKYTRLDGSININQRSESIEEFNKNDDVFIFLISTRAGGLGLNLTAADTVIFMDRDWNPMVDLQAQDRCHRIGQTKPVMVYSLIARGTVDEIIINRGEVKKRLEKIVLQEGKFQKIKRNFRNDELEELEEILNKEEQLQKVHPNGLIYSDEELLKILDRSELVEEMKKQNIYL